MALQTGTWQGRAMQQIRPAVVHPGRRVLTRHALCHCGHELLEESGSAGPGEPGPFWYGQGSTPNSIVCCPRQNRRRAGALQDASRYARARECRASVVECGGPPPLLHRMHSGLPIKPCPCTWEGSGCDADFCARRGVRRAHILHESVSAESPSSRPRVSVSSVKPVVKPSARLVHTLPHNNYQINLDFRVVKGYCY